MFLLFSLIIYIAYFHVFPRPFFQDLPLDVRTKIQNAKIENTQDIEWLRRIALLQDDAQRQDNLNSNKMLASGIDLLISIGLWAAGLFILNVFLWLKLMREQRNESVPWWLRWV